MIGWILVIGFVVLFYLQYQEVGPSRSVDDNITMDDVYIYATFDDTDDESL